MVIDYISAIPGTGKTRWAVAKMAAWLKDPEGYLIYVAPSKKLLREVEVDYLKKRVHKSLHSFIERIDSTNSDQVRDLLTSRLQGSTSKFGTVEKAPEGTVFLITHSAFLLMRKFPQSEKIHIIFDEARKCITQPVVLSLGDKTKERVFKLFKLTDVDNLFMRATAKSPMAKVTRVINSLEVDAKVKKSLLSLADSTTNPRLEVFLSKDKASNSLFEVILPSVIFEGFKSVTLMSAFFEDSQMYHLLKKRKVRMRDVTEKSIPNYKLEALKIKKRHSMIDLVPLCSAETSVLSKSKLGGLLVSLKHEETIVNALNELGVDSKSELKTLKASLANSQFKGTDAVETFKREWARKPGLVQLDPIKWLLKATAKVIDAWSQVNPVVLEPLVILNAKQKKEHESLMPQYHVETTNLHGLNTYLEHNVVAFLAAVNPSRKMISFYTRYLPGYNQAKDHVAEVCVQCVCRINVRDTRSDNRSLVIVPDQGIANLLSEKLEGRPILRHDLEPKASKVYVVLVGRTRKTRVKKRQSSTQRSAEWRKDPVNLALGRLSARLSYYKKTEPDSERFINLQETIAKIKETKKLPESLKHLGQPRGTVL